MSSTYNISMEWINNFVNTSKEIIVGKETEIKLVLAAILAKGHVLIEDIPGVGKTTMVKFFSKTLGLDMKRVQFTNDLLPSDIIGVNVFNPQNQEFSFHQGPIFGQLILADELNRASPKTQSALLQVMEERQVTVENNTFQLPEIFIVMATQNPRHQVGTNALPESQLDRFLMKLEMGYPGKEHEVDLIMGRNRDEMIESLKPVVTNDQLIQSQKAVNEVKASPKIGEYIVDLLSESRMNNDFSALSPRAGIDLLKAAKAWCYIENRQAVEPEDVQAIASAVLGHRLTNVYQSTVGLEKDLTAQLINTVDVY